MATAGRISAVATAPVSLALVGESAGTATVRYSSWGTGVPACARSPVCESMEAPWPPEEAGSVRDGYEFDFFLRHEGHSGQPADFTQPDAPVTPRGGWPAKMDRWHAQG
jgi:hypothetical protein